MKEHIGRKRLQKGSKIVLLHRSPEAQRGSFALLKTAPEGVPILRVRHRLGIIVSLHGCLHLFWRRNVPLLFSVLPRYPSCFIL
jgi:hypothetical protein